MYVSVFYVYLYFRAMYNIVPLY